MARALRIERPGGRYHVTARGNERKSIYRDDSDRTHFLELLAESTERSALRIHAYVLMENPTRIRRLWLNCAVSSSYVGLSELTVDRQRSAVWLKPQFKATPRRR